MKVANDPRFGKAGEDTVLVITPEGGGIKPEEATDEAWTLEIARALDEHYPGHPWIVSFQGGALIVRHVQIAHAVMMRTGKQGFGSVLPPHKQGSRKEAIASAVRFAGELLEAFQIPRGRWREECAPVCPDWNRGKTAGFT